jgi:hypothetical protein
MYWAVSVLGRKWERGRSGRTHFKASGKVHDDTGHNTKDGQGEGLGRGKVVLVPDRPVLGNDNESWDISRYCACLMDMAVTHENR